MDAALHAIAEEARSETARRVGDAAGRALAWLARLPGFAPGGGNTGAVDSTAFARALAQRLGPRAVQELLAEAPAIPGADGSSGDLTVGALVDAALAASREEATSAVQRTLSHVLDEAADAVTAALRDADPALCFTRVSAAELVAALPPQPQQLGTALGGAGGDPRRRTAAGDQAVSEAAPAAAATTPAVVTLLTAPVPPPVTGTTHGGAVNNAGDGGSGDLHTLHTRPLPVSAPYTLPTQQSQQYQYPLLQTASGGPPPLLSQPPPMPPRTSDVTQQFLLPPLPPPALPPLTAPQQLIRGVLAAAAASMGAPLPFPQSVASGSHGGFGFATHPPAGSGGDGSLPQPQYGNVGGGAIVVEKKRGRDDWHYGGSGGDGGADGSGGYGWPATGANGALASVGGPSYSGSVVRRLEYGSGDGGGSSYTDGDDGLAYTARSGFSASGGGGSGSSASGVSIASSPPLAPPLPLRTPPTVLPPLPHRIGGVGACHSFPTARGCPYRSQCHFFHITPRWVASRPRDAELIAQWERQTGVTLPPDRATRDDVVPQPIDEAAAAYTTSQAGAAGAADDAADAAADAAGSSAQVARRLVQLLPTVPRMWLHGLDAFARHLVLLLGEPTPALAAAADARGFVPSSVLDAEFHAHPSAPKPSHYTGNKFDGWLSRLTRVLAVEWRGPSLWVRLISPQQAAAHHPAGRTSEGSGVGSGGSSHGNSGDYSVSSDGASRVGSSTSGWAPAAREYRGGHRDGGSGGDSRDHHGEYGAAGSGDRGAGASHEDKRARHW